MIKKLTLFTFTLTLSFIVAFAQKGKVIINTQLPTWLQKVNVVNNKPAYKNIQDGYFIFLFEKQNNLETNEQYSHTIREISNATGVQNGSEISIPYDPSYEKLIFHKVVIWRDNKPLNKLNLQNFKILQNEKELSRFIYSGIFTAYLILDDIRKGDRIEYAYTIQGNNPVFPKYSNTIYFEGGSQIVNVYNNIIFNPNRKIKTKNFNDVPSVKKSVVNGLNVLEWQNSMTKTHPNNDFEPSSYNPFARVQISEYENWKEIVDWGLKLQNYDLKNSKIINEKIEELKLKSKGSQEKYLELATRFVQDEIRYMGIEIGEYSHRPNTPEKILKQRYGDCKDKSTLLCYLLNANGINAYSVFLDTYLNTETSTLLPSPSVFNHETVLVEYDDREIYIDPTMSNQRGSILNNYYPYLANVLVIKKGTTGLTTTPKPNAGKLKAMVKFKVGDTLANSKTTLTITSTYSNNYAENLRNDISNDGIESLEKSFVKYYANLYPGLTIKEPLDIYDNEMGNIITLKESYEIENFWTADENNKSKKTAYFYGDLVNDQINTLKKFRNAPMSLKFPSAIDQQIKIILPKTWTIENENVTIDKDDYRFVYSASSNKDTINLTYYYQCFSPILQPKALEAYIKDSKEVERLLSYGIYWNGNEISSPNDIDVKSIAIAFITFLIIGFLSFYIYAKRTDFDLEAIKNAWKIGGWLIIPAIGITISPLLILINTINLGVFKESMWKGIQASEHAFILNLSLLLTLIFNTILFTLSIFILISFYKRRNFFPKYYMGYLVFTFAITLADNLASYYITEVVSPNSINTFDGISITRIGIFSIIWITYFIKSERVKQTFVFSYPNSAWRTAIINDLNENFRVDNLQNDQIDKNIAINENERL